MNNEWEQHFAANFPLLPESDNADALAASAPDPLEQYTFMKQQDFDKQPTLGGPLLGSQSHRSWQYFGDQLSPMWPVPSGQQTNSRLHRQIRLFTLTNTPPISAKNVQHPDQRTTK